MIIIQIIVVIIIIGYFMKTAAISDFSIILQSDYGII